MSKRVLVIVGLVFASLVVLGIGAVAGSGIVYALTRGGKDGTSLVLPLESVALADGSELGVVIAAVEDGGPAAEAGVVRGDILLQVDEEVVDDLAKLMEILEGYEPGDEVELTVLHGDDERAFTVTLGDRDGKAYLGIVPCIGPIGPGPMMLLREGGPGAMIVEVEPDSPADLAGLQEGDIIVAVDGQKLDAESNLADIITSHEPGDSVTLEVERFGEEPREVMVELGEHPEEEGVTYLGVRCRPSPPSYRFRLEGPHFERRRIGPPFHVVPGSGVKQGAIVRSVEDGSPAAEAGLREGDLIIAINGDPIEGPWELADAIAEHEPSDQMTLTVQHPDDEEEREVEVTLAEHPEEEGKAYLGVEIGGFIHVHRGGESEWHHGEDSFEYFFDWDAPFDEAPFDLEEMLPHFELQFSPEHFDGDGCCGGSI
jgi:S1-C subfamily serine protease